MAGDVARRGEPDTVEVLVAEDAAEAVKWYRKAAEQEESSAQYSLGLSYANGEGVAKDPVRALMWFMNAAESGNETAG